MTAPAEAPVTYPREAVLTIEQLAAGLGVSVRVAERLDLPTLYIGPRLKRYVWGAILDVLTSRSESGK